MFKLTQFFFCLLTILLPTQVFAQEKVPILVYHHIDQFPGHGQKELSHPKILQSK